ncbi:Ppx/GppA family phosphatase [Peteryoungia desertarenae]|uniref:Ppx/GppA family phosphatase n=1 Tax=Peteryoungia desertarenae TaxID=1813451 RepID=A0ABX6QLR3_9HYPH|nr:Ppx/GppA phosphatase family protein [Peteryoungia desertarenae]QLF69470.1 Ppx/GppA family phosphatase [Peteryoungia desertarenae]
MTDPDRGETPKSEGASTAKRRNGGTRRRGKARKKVSASSGAVNPALTVPTQESDRARRSDISDADGPIRKRKRRRRGKSQSLRPDASSQAAASPSGTREAVAPLDGDNRPDAGPAHGRKRKKNRNRRNSKIRPLTGSAPPAPSQQIQARLPQNDRLEQTAKVATSSDLKASSLGDRPRSSFQGSDRFSDDLYAALDLGTNNCRLLIAQPTRPGQFRVVDAFSRIVRLGEGLGANGRLSQDAMDRAVEALKICSNKLSGRSIRRHRLIATEACRAAENGEAFLARVTQETGLRLEIINRETEARLAVSGCSSLVGREARSVVLFDIGGGSSEIAVLRIDENRSSRLANHITHWTSLPVGVVTLSERHGGRDVTPEVFAAMTAEVENMLARFDCPDIHDGSGDFYLIGTSGTVTTLAGVHLDLPRYDRRRVDGLWLTDAEVTAMQAKLLSWDFAGRAANPCIGPDRADLVLAGCAILEAIRRRWPSTRMRVADRGLREGLLTDMMADDGVWRRGRYRRPPQTKED